MKAYYPVVFTPDGGGYQVRVPDLPGLVTYGEDITDAFDMAQDAIEMWHWDAENKNEDIPEPSTVVEIMETYHFPDQLTSVIAVDTSEYRKRRERNE